LFTKYILLFVLYAVAMWYGAKLATAR